ncbi:hypothetical protein CONPUDRAFT_42105, partial [Coniophora puteana RWD-64-598 SS2]
DGHGSHVTSEMVRIGFDNDVMLYCLPPHTTHRLQPCDVGAFGPLKKFWFTAIEWYLRLTGRELGTNHVPLIYMLARRAAFQPRTLLRAWSKSGI